MRKNRRWAYPLVLACALAVSTVACNEGDGNGDGEGGGNSGAGPLELSGQLADHPGEEADLSHSARLDDESRDVAEGTLNADGSFSLTLLGHDDIKDVIRPLGGMYSEGYFASYPCHGRAEVEISDMDAKLLAVTYFDGGWWGPNNSYQGITLVLSDVTDRDVNITRPLPGTTPERRVFWIYADRPVQIAGQCQRETTSSGWPASVDLDLKAGWNEANWDFDNETRQHLTTGDRHPDVDWVVNGP